MIIKMEMGECAFGEIYAGGRAGINQENVVVPDARKGKKEKYIRKKYKQ